MFKVSAKPRTSSLKPPVVNFYNSRDPVPAGGTILRFKSRDPFWRTVLRGDHPVDASRCIAYTSIEHRGPVDEQLAEAAGDWLFGCDICQEVCPHSARSKRQPPPPVNEVYESRHDGFDLLEVLGWNEESRMERLLGTAAKRANLTMWKRNAAICAVNAIRAEPDRVGVEALRRRLLEIASDQDEDPMVRAAASRVDKG